MIISYIYFVTVVVVALNLLVEVAAEVLSDGDEIVDCPAVLQSSPASREEIPE